MSIVGEAALGAFFQVLFGKLSSSEVLDFVTEKQVRKELKKWKSMLQGMRAVLDDAEEGQMKDQTLVKDWLADLQDLAYDVDDILDEFATQALERSLTSLEEPEANRSKVQKFIPTRLFCPKTLMFNKKMMSKIKKISARMNDLGTRKNILGLQGKNEGVSSNRIMQQSVQPAFWVDETDVYGRRDDKAAIIQLLLSSHGPRNKASVIPIVGMGGIGKTTLAHLVYNDPIMKDSFDHKALVCVSVDFDAVMITKKILEWIAPPNSCTDINDPNLLQVKLEEILVGKRFLLVLDDIWNENYLELNNLLSLFGVGTKILVTTRSQIVADLMGTAEAYPLQQLSEEHCLSIFTQHALGANDFSGHPELEEVGKIIVKKCKGLPLAAKAIGGSLRTYPYATWKGISESQIWGEECGVLPALRLSYHHLPSHLKQCFAYCSILPKDYEFKEKEIILLWEAEGFLYRASPESQIEGLGSRYFRDLVSRSFFQTSASSRSLFVMHDLINDLAQSVAGDICASLEGDKPLRFSNRTRHSSYVRGEYDAMNKFEAFNQMKFLRTFLPLSRSQDHCYLSRNVLIDLLSKLRRLRVLSLNSYKITELPNIFQNLRHLRYLDFSYTSIESLPESTCTLYNLKTLLLEGCSKLEKLPSNLPILVNLTVLDITATTNLKGMPLGIGKLTNLQRLSDFVLGKGDGHQLQELKNLANLKGRLSISGLGNIVKAEDAREAKLIDKSGLDTLELRWSLVFDYNGNTEVEEEVLNFLEPQKKLEKLSILNYGGTKFPIWMNSLQNLSSLILNGCKNCVSLPAVGKLPLLKDLSICGMDELSKVGIEFYGENPSNAFASLQSLSFKNMPRWKEWDLVDENAAKFPSLVKLSITNCPQLVVSLVDLPKLSELHIEECAELVLRDDAEFPSIEEVHLSKVEKFFIPKDLGLLRHLRSRPLRDLKIVGCPQLVLLEPDDEQEAGEKLCNIDSMRIQEDGLSVEFLRIRKHFLAVLTEIEIMNCPNIVSFASNNFPPVLKKLKIEKCEKLRCLMDEGENMSFSNISPLEHLKIKYCPSLLLLLSLPVRLQHLEIWSCSKLASLSLPVRLQYLEIWSCSKLASLSESGKLPIGLKKLRLSFCPLLESVAEAINENACLKSISIFHCGIESLPQGLDKLNHLRWIKINDCQNLVSLAGNLPTTNLTDLWIHGCDNLRALPNCMHNLTSLRELRLFGQISIPEEGICANLTSLSISVPRNYESLLQREFHGLTSLQSLYLSGEQCPNVVSFPPEEIEKMLPPSLNSLSIADFPSLKRVSSKGFQNLASLHHLYIFNCPNLTSLPEKDMLLSLLVLSISNCPSLVEKCKRRKGREWSKIAHIPCVQLD